MIKFMLLSQEPWDMCFSKNTKYLGDFLKCSYIYRPFPTSFLLVQNFWRKKTLFEQNRPCHPAPTPPPQYCGNNKNKNGKNTSQAKRKNLGNKIVENWKFAAPNSCSNLPNKPPPSSFKLQAGKFAKPIRNKNDEFTGPEDTAALLIVRRQACLQTLCPGFENENVTR